MGVGGRRSGLFASGYCAVFDEGGMNAVLRDAVTAAPVRPAGSGKASPRGRVRPS